MTDHHWHVQLLKCATDMLQAAPVTAYNRGLCWALDRAWCYLFKETSSVVEQDQLSAALYIVKRMITEQLGWYLHLQDWLEGEHGINWRDDLPKLRATRLAWIDDMINYWSKQ
jgi:hypothetical protein